MVVKAVALLLAFLVMPSTQHTSWLKRHRLTIWWSWLPEHVQEIIANYQKLFFSVFLYSSSVFRLLDLGTYGTVAVSPSSHEVLNPNPEHGDIRPLFPVNPNGFGNPKSLSQCHCINASISTRPCIDRRGAVKLLTRNFVVFLIWAWTLRNIVTWCNMSPPQICSPQRHHWLIFGLFHQRLRGGWNPAEASGDPNRYFITDFIINLFQYHRLEKGSEFRYRDLCFHFVGTCFVSLDLMLALNAGQEASELVELDIENIRRMQWQLLTSTICDESRTKNRTCNILQVSLFTRVLLMLNSICAGTWSTNYIENILTNLQSTRRRDSTNQASQSNGSSKLQS